jgi:hypothetical protein
MSQLDLFGEPKKKQEQAAASSPLVRTPQQRRNFRLKRTAEQTGPRPVALAAADEIEEEETETETTVVAAPRPPRPPLFAGTEAFDLEARRIADEMLKLRSEGLINEHDKDLAMIAKMIHLFDATVAFVNSVVVDNTENKSKHASLDERDPEHPEGVTQDRDTRNR